MRNGRVSEILYILPLLKCLEQLGEKTETGLMRTIASLVLLKNKNRLFSVLQSDPSSQPKRNAFKQAKQYVQKKIRNIKDD